MKPSEPDESTRPLLGRQLKAVEKLDCSWRFVALALFVALSACGQASTPQSSPTVDEHAFMEIVVEAERVLHDSERLILRDPEGDDEGALAVVSGRISHRMRLLQDNAEAVYLRSIGITDSEAMGSVLVRAVRDRLRDKAVDVAQLVTMGRTWSARKPLPLPESRR